MERSVDGSSRSWKSLWGLASRWSHCCIIFHIASSTHTHTYKTFNGRHTNKNFLPNVLTFGQSNKARSKTVNKNEINCKGSTGYDLIYYRSYFNSSSNPGYLLFEYNVIEKTGYFPRDWKLAKLITFSECGKPRDEFTSYRPIKHNPRFSKIFAKFLFN